MARGENTAEHPGRKVGREKWIMAPPTGVGSGQGLQAKSKLGRALLWANDKPVELVDRLLSGKDKG